MVVNARKICIINLNARGFSDAISANRAQAGIENEKS